jgi:hypothetical protein
MENKVYQELNVQILKIESDLMKTMNQEQKILFLEYESKVIAQEKYLYGALLSM